MKKIVFATFVFFFTIFTQVYAVIPSSEAALGGIVLGTRVDDLKEMYGEPSKIHRELGGSMTYEYGDSLKIYLISGKACYVGRIDTCANNGIKMPSGITVGDSVDVLYEAGFGDYHDRGHSNGTDVLAWKTDSGDIMEFHYKDGVITKIILTRELCRRLVLP